MNTNTMSKTSSAVISSTLSAPRDPAITTLRMLAMIGIVLTHLAQYYELGDIKHVLRLGTPLFFLMSGFLYGQKQINQWGKFYYRRWKTLMIPVYIWIVIVGILSAILFSTHYSAWQYITHIFNLAGLQNVTFMSNGPAYELFTMGGNLKSMSGMGHLWFMTFLMVCLFLVPLLQFVRNKFSQSRLWGKGWTPVCVMFLICCLGLYYGLFLWYIGVFIIGYCVNKNLILRSVNVIYLISAIILIGGVCMILGHKFIGFTDVYKSGIYQISQTMIVCGVLGIVQYIFHRYPQLKGLPSVGNYTYCVYTVHYVFLVGILSVMKLLGGEPLVNVPLYIAVILVAALCLQKMTKWIDVILLKD